MTFEELVVDTLVCVLMLIAFYLMLYFSNLLDEMSKAVKRIEKKLNERHK